MPRLSAIDSVNPAMERAKAMVIPFRFATWLKLGFIGWLAAEMAGFGFNFNFPTSFPRSGGRVPPFRIPGIHFPTGALAAIIVAVVVIVFLVSLVFVYLSARFRFILFDSVIHGEANIGRGWSSYARPANRYFGFLFAYSLVALLALAAIIGLPLWGAYKRGVFSGGNILGPVFALIGSIIVMVLLFMLVNYVIGTLFRDFLAPLLALDDLRLGEAWAAVWHFARNEPAQLAGYLGMKLVLALAAAIAVGFATFICLLILLIPGVVIVIVFVAVGSALHGKVAIAGLVALAGVVLMVFAVAMFIISLTLQAPVAVFFESYRLYFFAGRYPKLETLLWPAPPAPLIPEPPPPSAPPLPEPGLAG